jgi:CheY-like chemotaxis protein
LLVEDNTAHAELVMRSLGEHPLVHDIVHLRDGESALDYLFRRGEYTDPNTSPSPHLVLLDLRLPRVDGIEVLQTIRQSKTLRRMPVVILTTSEAEQDIARAYDAYVNSYVVKPLDFDSFTQLMKDVGLYWLEWNRKA